MTGEGEGSYDDKYDTDKHQYHSHVSTVETLFLPFEEIDLCYLIKSYESAGILFN
jgi:hypothetical protein